MSEALDTLIETLSHCGEVTRHMSDLSWLDDESVPASWLYAHDEDPGQYDEPPPLPTAASQLSRPTDPDQLAAAEDPDQLAAATDPDQLAAATDPEPPPEPPWWLTDEFCGTPEEEHAAWLASLPEDIRSEYLTAPDTEPGFTHHDGGGRPGTGFAAGGELDQMPPGPWLAQALAEETGPGSRELTDSEQIGVLCGWQRQVAWAHAGMAAAITAVVSRRRAQSTRPGWSQLADHIIDELAVALRMTTRAAGFEADAAAGLARLPAVAAALAAGRLDRARATVITSQLFVLTDEQATATTDRILPRAPEQTTAQLRAALARAVLAADPAAADRRKKEGRKDTRVEAWDEASGNKVLAGRELASADAIAADAQLTADAHWLRRRGAPGTLAELRAGAFIARLSGRDLVSLLPGADDATPDPDESSGNPARDPAAGPEPSGTINLTMPLSAYAGLDDGPGEAAGHGAIDAETSRALALRMGGTARWCLTLTGPDGRAVAHACARTGHAPVPGSPAIRWAAGLRERLQFLETGACSHRRQVPGYTWPGGLRHLIEIRQRTCTAPGCRRTAPRCDIDHTTPFDQGGRTCECNGGPLCRRHHRAKQAPGWHLTQDQPGAMTWRLPGGREYQTTGPPYLE